MLEEEKKMISEKIKEKLEGIEDEGLKNEYLMKLSQMGLNDLIEELGVIKWTEEERKNILLAKILQKQINFVELAREFIKLKPLYYDKNKIWWSWNEEKKCWEMVDETEILKEVVRILEWAGVVNQHNKSQFLTALQVVSREKPPKEPNKYWIQFRDKIVDVKTGEMLDASPEWFITNVIPHKLGDSEETPMIDKLFSEWVGKENKQTLYEIVAYSMLRDYPIHRLFCLVGSGRNGKGSFMRLLARFLGKENTTSTDLDRIANSRFETARLYKKLVAFIGETNFNVLEKTAIIKQLTGQDLIPAEFKQKPTFEFYNYAKILIATNSLPITKDKTEGFYSRWIIINFPNQFPEGKDIVDSIPEEEFEGLTRKSFNILRMLLLKGKFTNEGSIHDKMKIYEDMSNPLKKFIEIYTENDPEGYIELWEFYDRFALFLKQNGYRVLSRKDTTRMLKDEGYYIDRKWITHNGEKKQYRCVFGIKWRNSVTDVTDVTDVPIKFPIYRNLIENSVTSVTSVTKSSINENEIRNLLQFLPPIFTMYDVDAVCKDKDIDSDKFITYLFDHNLIMRTPDGRFKKLI